MSLVLPSLEDGNPTSCSKRYSRYTCELGVGERAKPPADSVTGSSRPYDVEARRALADYSRTGALGRGSCRDGW
jgi:hypothetical protein